MYQIFVNNNETRTPRTHEVKSENDPGPEKEMFTSCWSHMMTQRHEGVFSAWLELG